MKGFLNENDSFLGESRKGQITIPIEARKHLNMQPGVRVQFVLEKDSIRIVPVENGIEEMLKNKKVLSLKKEIEKKFNTLKQNLLS